MIRLPSPSYNPAFCSVVVDVFSRVLSLAKASHFFTLDLLRHILQLTRKTFDLCLNAPMTSSTRSRCLLRVVESARSIVSRFDLAATAVEDLPARLLARQLVREINDQSSPSLIHLASLFSNETDPFVLTPVHASAVVDVISKGNILASAELQVAYPSCCSCIQSSSSLQWQALSRNFLCKQMDRMTTHASWGTQKHLNGVEQLSSSENEVPKHLQPKPPEWRTLAMHELRVLIDAGNAIWMDVDDGLSDTLYARRGLDIIKQVLDR